MNSRIKINMNIESSFKDLSTLANCFGHTIGTIPSWGIDVTYNHILNILEIQQYSCALTNVSLSLVPNNLRTISIDKIDFTKAYVPDNIQLVCKWVSLAKQGFSNKEFMKVLEMATIQRFTDAGINTFYMAYRSANKNNNSLLYVVYRDLLDGFLRSEYKFVNIQPHYIDKYKDDVYDCGFYIVVYGGNNGYDAKLDIKVLQKGNKVNIEALSVQDIFCNKIVCWEDPNSDINIIKYIIEVLGSYLGFNHSIPGLVRFRNNDNNCEFVIRGEIGFDDLDDLI